MAHKYQRIDDIDGAFVLVCEKNGIGLLFVLFIFVLFCSLQGACTLAMPRRPLTRRCCTQIRSVLLSMVCAIALFFFI